MKEEAAAAAVAVRRHLARLPRQKLLLSVAPLCVHLHSRSCALSLPYRRRRSPQLQRLPQTPTHTSTTCGSGLQRWTPAAPSDGVVAAVAQGMPMPASWEVRRTQPLTGPLNSALVNIQCHQPSRVWRASERRSRSAAAW